MNGLSSPAPLRAPPCSLPRAKLGLAMVVAALMACLLWTTDGRAGPSASPSPGALADPASPSVWLESVKTSGVPATGKVLRALSAPETAALLRRLPPLPRPAAPPRPIAFARAQERGVLSVPAASVKTAPQLGSTTMPEFQGPSDEAGDPPPSSPPPSRPSPQPLGVTRHVPEGYVPNHMPITVLFSQPMVELQATGANNAQVPAVLTPPLDGKWRWEDPCTATFEPTGRLPANTRCTVTVPRGTTSLEGGRLPSDVQWTFATLPPRLAEAWPQGRDVSRDPLFVAQFDQPVKPWDVSVTLLENQHGVALRMVEPQEAADDIRVKTLGSRLVPGRWLAYKAMRTLASDAHIEVKLAYPQGPPSVSDRWSFQVSPPLKVVSQGSQREQDRRFPLLVWFNNALSPGSLRPAAIQVSPPLPGLKFEARGHTLIIRRGAQEDRRCTVTLLPGCLSDRHHQTLALPYKFAWGGTRRSRDSAPRRGRPYLYPPGRTCETLDRALAAAWPIRSVGARRIRVQAWKVSPSDWPRYRALPALAASHPKRILEESQVPGRQVFDRTLAVRGDLRSDATTPMDLRPLLPQGSGHLIVRVSAPGAESHILWLQVSSLAAEVAVEAGQVMAWVTSLDTGQPVKGASVGLLPGPLAARTNGDGLARLPVELNAARAHQAISVQVGEESLIVPDIADFQDFRSHRNSLLWHVYDDRGLYRPGEEAHVKGLLRHVAGTAGSDLHLPGEVACRVRYDLMQDRQTIQG